MNKNIVCPKCKGDPVHNNINDEGYSICGMCKGYGEIHEDGSSIKLHELGSAQLIEKNYLKSKK